MPFTNTPDSSEQETPQDQWYAVHTRCNAERRVAMSLAEKQVEHYLPVFSEVHKWKDRNKSVDVPIFSGYLFARFVDTPAERLRVLLTSGVLRVLGSEVRAEPVPDSQIEAIRRMLAGSGGQCFREPWLRTGKRVRVRRGPLKDVEGFLVRVKSQARLIISVDLLAQSVATEVDVNDVDPVDGPAFPMN
jgi:transcription termination/antitermination protein NusG